LHHRYRQEEALTEMLQEAAHRAVANADRNVRASGFTAVSVTARLTRTR